MFGVSVRCRPLTSDSFSNQIQPSSARLSPPHICEFCCLFSYLCWTWSVPHNMPHQPCFHQPLGQQRQSRERPLPRRRILCLWSLQPLSSCSLLSSFFFTLLSTLIHIFSPFFPQLPPQPPPPPRPPHSSLMLPNTLSSSPFLLHPLSISCFVCKPQGREMGEKHSLCTTVTKDWWVIDHLCSCLPPPTKKHTYTG